MKLLVHECRRSTHPDEEDKFDLDSLDDTTTWPEDLASLQPVGRHPPSSTVINVDTFFNENEQLAFGPGLAVLGRDLLLRRQDAAVPRVRLRQHCLAPNYLNLMLPVNVPKCAAPL
jgi:catalase